MATFIKTTTGVLKKSQSNCYVKISRTALFKRLYYSIDSIKQSRRIYLNMLLSNHQDKYRGDYSMPRFNSNYMKY